MTNILLKSYRRNEKQKKKDMESFQKWLTNFIKRVL